MKTKKAARTAGKSWARGAASARRRHGLPEPRITMTEDELGDLLGLDEDEPTPWERGAARARARHNQEDR